MQVLAVRPGSFALGAGRRHSPDVALLQMLDGRKAIPENDLGTRSRGVSMPGTGAPTTPAGWGWFPILDHIKGPICMRSCFIITMPRRRDRHAAGVVLASWVLAGTLLVVPVIAAAEGDKPNPERPAATALSPASERMKSDITFLAADAQDGRAPGTKGIEVSASYIADVFKGAGLKPAPGAEGYFQPFSISGRPTLGNEQELVLSGPDAKEVKGTFRTDFVPMAFGIGATLEQVPIVFAGYGITASDETLKINYDDYAGIDVKGKAVLVIRREPQQADDASPFDGKRTTQYATFKHKATNAFQHGAVAVLLVNDQAGLEGNKDELLPFARGESDVYSKLPFVMISRDFADKLLIAAGAAGPLTR